MQRLCERCNKRNAEYGAIIQGIYYHLCGQCMPRSKVSSGHARWERSIDLEDHEADIQQPYNADGSINPDFARLYPKQAAALFTPDQLRRANMS